MVQNKTDIFVNVTVRRFSLTIVVENY